MITILVNIPIRDQSKISINNINNIYFHNKIKINSNFSSRMPEAEESKYSFNK